MMISKVDLAAHYQRHREAMIRTAASVLRGVGRSDEAMDAVQDAVLSLLQSPPGEIKNWEAILVSAARRRALDRVNSARVRHAGPPIEHGDEEPWLADESPSVETQVLDQLGKEELSSLLDSCAEVLDERHKQVVWGIQIHGRSRPEIALELGVTPARVSQIVAKALGMMRQELEQREEVRQWIAVSVKNS